MPVLRLLTFALVLASLSLQAKPDLSKLPPVPPALRGVGLDQKLNAQVPLNLAFRDDAGQTVPLSTYFGKKPVILALVYYQCPMLCTEILNGLVRSLKAVSFKPGIDFEVVTVSIDPTETPDLAAHKKAGYLKRYGRGENGWHFLTGEEPQIKSLAQAIGFRYTYDPKTKQFAHASGIMVLTPEGKLSHYFYGVEYAPRDLRLGLVEASQNKIGTPVDQILLFCYHYDPATGKYGAVAMNIVRLAGVAFVLILSLFLFIMFRRDFRRDRRANEARDRSMLRVR